MAENATTSDTDSPSFFVVLDTNIWVYREHLLRSPRGQSLLYTIKNGNARLALPDVVRDEIVKHTRKRGIEKCDEVGKPLRQLEALAGRGLGVSFPSGADLEQLAKSRLAELADHITAIPYRDEHARAAYARLLRDLPPNRERDQQYKDCLIWETILELSQQSPVYFVTGDLSFFEDRKPKDGPARPLADEIATLPNPVRLFDDLGRCLEELKPVVPRPDLGPFLVAISSFLSSQVDQFMQKHRLVRTSTGTDKTKNRLSVHFTEQPERVAIDFTVYYPCGLVHEREEPSEQGYVAVKGACLVDRDERKIIQMELDSMSLEDERGNRIPGYGRTVYLRVRDILGLSRRPEG